MNRLKKTILTSILAAGLVFSGGSPVLAGGQDAMEAIPSDPFELYSSFDTEDFDFLLDTDEELCGDDEISCEKVISSVDNRKPIEDPLAYPYSAICKLVITFSPGGRDLTFIGTGFLVAPNKVLTAGHCLYERAYGMAKSVMVIPGAGKDGSAPFGSETVYTDNMYVSEAWKLTSATDFDFGVLKLQEPLGNEAGTLKLAANPKASVNRQVELSGYPYSSGQDIDTLEQYYDRNVLLALGASKQRTLYHVLDSGAGQSGSPLLNEDFEVVGLHTFAVNNQPLNGGVLIDDYIRDFVQECDRTGTFAPTEKDTPVYRVYNEASSEHFYTPSLPEAEQTVSQGWKDEGVSWYSQSGGVPIYRLFNPNSGDHHYTLSKEEAEALCGYGWNDENIAWYGSDDPDALPVYRLYNPNAVTGAHHFTVSPVERDHLVGAGWSYEGIAFHTN